MARRVVLQGSGKDSMSLDERFKKIYSDKGSSRGSSNGPSPTRRVVTGVNSGRVQKSPRGGRRGGSNNNDRGGRNRPFNGGRGGGGRGSNKGGSRGGRGGGRGGRGRGGKQQKIPSKDKLDSQLDNWMLQDKEKGGAYLNDELDTYMKDRDSRGEITNGHTEENKGTST